MSRLYVPELFRLQQKILTRAWDNTRDENGIINSPTISQLVELTGKDKTKVLRAVNCLQERELAYHEPQTDIVACRPKGRLVLFKEDILDEGWEKFKVNLLRWVQILGIASGSCIAIATFIVNVMTTTNNKIELGKLRQEIQELKRIQSTALQVQPKVQKPVVISKKGK